MSQTGPVARAPISNHLKPSQTSQTISNYLKLSQTISNYLKLPHRLRAPPLSVRRHLKLPRANLSAPLVYIKIAKVCAPPVCARPSISNRFDPLSQIARTISNPAGAPSVYVPPSQISHPPDALLSPPGSTCSLFPVPFVVPGRFDFERKR